MTHAFSITQKNREILESFLNDFSIEQLNKIPNHFKNNIFWNIAHIVATQQLLVYKLSNQTMLINEAWVNEFAKGTKPERIYTQTDIDFLKSVLFSTLLKTKEDFENQLFTTFIPYTTSQGFEIKTTPEAIHFNNFHEGIHLGIILQLKKFV